MNKTIKYPQYRKYLNNKSFYKIISEIKWEELVVLGNTVTKHQFIVKILPDRNYIYDLTFDYQNHWVKIEEEEYTTIHKKLIL
ncbi:MAG: hypothetical protein ABI315_06505 [Bacteroidia bacterium]